ncbi:hypothetical protein SAY87_007150 [Trapa incisa]|uniref:TPX2 C-terminal domain-containing protein n=1 Tax=Trapa incisa TaxID=236973 RepID=A0AAN7Q0D7_9MYRT|nr:hypothetical protein SAY87_007150 [Trapa incisa]
MDTNKHLKVKSVMEHSSALVNHVGQEVLGKMMAGGCCGGQEALGLNITNRSPDSLPHEKKERLLSRRLSHSLEVESAMECAVVHGSYVGHVIPGLKSINHSSDFVLHDKKRSGSQSSNLAIRAYGKSHRVEGEDKVYFHYATGVDCSTVASPRSFRSLRSYTSSATVATALSFRSNERAEKRKEFYFKLEEKHQAMEAETSRYEARRREEEVAHTKKLRKSMVFKANPLPSFYNVGSPPKPEIMKLPLTRPRSPKLGHRRNPGDAFTSSQDERNKPIRVLHPSVSRINHKGLTSSP